MLDEGIQESLRVLHKNSACGCLTRFTPVATTQKLHPDSRWPPEAAEIRMVE
jgi:hypothetical protein